MKSQNSSPRSTSAGRRARSPMRIPQIPMEWMDPMSWRLPSGKRLAEFALQAGFLAPLMLGTPTFKRRKPEPGQGGEAIKRAAGSKGCARGWRIGGDGIGLLHGLWPIRRVGRRKKHLDVNAASARCVLRGARIQPL